MFRKLFLTLAASCLSLIAPLSAQGTDPLLTTVGTTVSADGKTHAYVLWQPGNAASTFGKRFAIYSKPGPIGAAGNFTRLGIQTLQTSPATIRALLVLGEKIDVAGEHAPERIDGLYRDVTFNAAEPPATPADPNLDAAGKLAYLIASAVDDPKLLGRLFFLGRAHPGVMMCLGHAFAIQVTAGAATYEVREVGGNDQDLQVVGRVVLDPATPVVLDAPASPIQVPHPVTAGSQYPINPKDNLNARFRWGVGPVLKAKMPYSFGFDLFRVKESVAVSLGWHTTAPDPAVMLDAVEGEDPTDPTPDFGRVNMLPVMIGDLLDPAAAADLSNKERFDLADDGVWYRGEDGRQIRRPFADGESFYYYVAARGITGLPGKLSPGSLVRMCDRMPPDPPSIISVQSTFVPAPVPAGQNGSQFLRVKFRQVNGEEMSDTATGYYVYRWSTSNDYLASAGNPMTGRIGYVAHTPGQTYATFDDKGAGAPTITTHPDRAVWYTIRAVGNSACPGETLGGHGAPASGVLRDFKAPDGPTGSFLVCRTLPGIEFVRRSGEKPKDGSIPREYEGITVDVAREHSTVVGADIQILLGKSQESSVTLYEKRHYFQRTDLIRVTLPFREPMGKSEFLFVRVRALGGNGMVSGYTQGTSPESQGLPYARYEFKTSATRRCSPIGSVPDNPPKHDSFNPDGTANPIGGSIEVPPNQGVKEWRIYRRVGDGGELSLIAKQEGSIPPSSVWEDDALPAQNGVQVCYYAQVFDQNANPSPLIPLGCVVLTNPDLPTPMLSPVELLDESGGVAQAQLEWFCDPVGVDRFEILIAQEGGGVPEITGLSEVLGESPVAGIPSEDPDLSFYPFQTPRVTSVFGPGPAFGYKIGVPADKVLHFAVRACGPGPFPRPGGAASNVVRTRWQTTESGPQPIIPWPARPIPGTYEMRRTIETYAPGEGPLWTMKMPANSDVATCVLVGLVRGAIESSGQGKSTMIQGSTPPEDRLFRLRNSLESGGSTRPLMDFMIYRYQLPSAAFPTARPNLVQCTPLLDRMSWRRVTFGKDPGIQLSDPFFRVVNLRENYNIPLAGPWTDTVLPTIGNPITSGLARPPYIPADVTAAILVDDPLPVIEGARYRHLIVTFTERGEIRNVIPLEPVQH
ncbi:hypothetical protein OKA04_18875 [Luteolibacter flavescens]|uniref:Uncharacterized protein n=1 Tax=Luteolibacter flavescens TaxID=1859460 RepID=A0ABT3FTA8_9BACT|nr:hypothetical protein [Luteolibacter flavescens]MCW1886811.1 hypothetical protein [Luteolibacter flavescens]